MRILAIGHSWVVPIYRILFDYLSNNKYIKITVVIPDYWEEAGNRVITQGPSPTNYNLIIQRPFSHRQHLHFYPKISKILLQVNPDIILFLEEPHSLVTASTLVQMKLLCPNAKGLFFTFLNDDRNFSHMPGIRKVIFPLALKTTFSLASGAICSSKPAEQQMKRRGFKKSTWVIPFGTDVRKISSINSKKVAEIRKKIAPNSKFLVGFVGRIIRGKGLDLLLNSIASLKDKINNIYLVIIGDGPEMPSIKKQAIKLGLLDSIIFVGVLPHDNVHYYMASLNILVVPSRKEGDWVEQYGRVIIEGMSLRVPVIGSTSGEIPKVIGNFGLVFEEENFLDLSNKILKIYNLNNEQKLALLEKAYNYVLNYHDFKAVATAYQKIFFELK